MKKIPNTLYYYVSFSLMPVLGVLQMKILTTILTTSNFAQIQLILPIIGWGVIIGGLGLPQYIVRFYAVYQIEIFKKGMACSLFFMLLTFPTAYMASTGIDVSKLGFIPDFKLWGVVFVTIVMLTVFNMVRALLRVQQKHFIYNFTVIFQKIFVLFCGIAGIFLISNSPVMGFFVGNALGGFFVIMILFGFLHGEISWIDMLPSFSQVKEMLKYGVPIITVLLMSNMLATVNRYIIAYKLDVNEVAVFVVGSTIVNICFSFIYEPILVYGHPYIFNAWEKSGKKATENIVNRYLKVYVIIGLLMLGLVVHFEDILVNIVSNDQYRLPQGCFVLLGVAAYVLGIYRFLVTHYLLRKNTSELIVCFLISVICSVTMALFLIGPYGIVGVCIAAVMGTAVLCFVVWWRGRGILRMRMIPKHFYTVFLFTIVLCSVSPAHQWEMSSIWRWADFLGVLAAALLIVLLINVKQYISVEAKDK